MPLTLKALREWPPEIDDLAGATRAAAANHTGSADFYRSLATASTWEGDGGEAAKIAMVASAGDHDAAGENLGAAAAGMEQAQLDADVVATEINSILNEAAVQPVVQIDETTNQVIPPSTEYLDEDAAADVEAKVADLRARIAAVLADGERVDADLARAIGVATGGQGPAAATRSPWQNLLLPPSGRTSPTRADTTETPQDLDDALGQLTGAPRAFPHQGWPASDPAEAGASAPMRLDPASVEAFKTTARRIMALNGMPPDQIEKRLDDVVANGLPPYVPYTSPEPEAMPTPGFGEGFGDRWFATEQAIDELLGQGGPGAPGVLEAWGDLAKGTADRLSNPIGAVVGDVKDALDSPSAAYFLGEKSADAAVTAPGLVFAPEAALARAALLDDLAGSPGVPQDLIDNPTPTGVGDHPTPFGASSDSHGTSLPEVGAPASPLPPDSPLFNGYLPADLGPEFTRPDGSLIYPDGSLPEKPYAIPGTVVANADIPQGTVIDRFGGPYGSWMSPDGTPFANRALPPDSASKDYYQYVVDDPAKLPPGFRIEQSQAAPWFNQPGDGIQYRIIGPDGKDASVDALTESGYLRDHHE